MKYGLRYTINYKRSYGFTLVELLVTVSIIILLTVVAIPNFSKYRNINEINNAAKIMQSEIYKAKSYALSPDTNKDPQTNAYEFVLQKNEDNTYVMNIWQVLYENVDEITRLKKVDEAKISKNITIDCLNDDECLRILYSIEKYGRIVDIGPVNIQDDENPLLYFIDMTSIKTNDVIKQIWINKVTGQVNIQTRGNANE